MNNLMDIDQANPKKVHLIPKFGYWTLFLPCRAGAGVRVG